MLNNYIQGKSVVFGTSFIDFNSSVNVVENYSIGGTVIAYDRGEFVINSYSKPTSNNQRISLSLSRPNSAGKQFSPFNNREVPSGYRLTDFFDQPQNIDVSTNGAFSTSAGTNTFYVEKGTIGNAWVVYKGEDRDMYMQLRYQFAGETFTYGYHGLLLRSENPGTPESDNAYVVGVNSIGASSQFFIGQVINGGITMLTKTGISMHSYYGNGSDWAYDILAYAKGGKIYGAISGASIEHNSLRDVYPGLTYSTSLTIDSARNVGGYFGLYGNASGTSGIAIIYPDFFTMSTLNKPLTYEEIVYKSYYMSDSWENISFETGLTFYEPYFPGSVGSWTQGYSDSTYSANLNVVSGTSLNWMTNFGSVSSEYVYETEMMGASGVRGGLFIGNSASMYAMTAIIGSTSTTNLTYKTGNNLLLFQNGNPFIYIEPNKWNKVTACRFGREISFYINGQLANYLMVNTSGVSASGSIPNTGNGIVSKQTGVSGGTLQFRNPRIQILPVEADNLVMPSGTQLGSVADRYLSGNFFEVQGASSVKISFIGASRWQVGLSNLCDNLDINSKTEGIVMNSFTRGNKVVDTTTIGVTQYFLFKPRWGSVSTNYDSNAQTFGSADIISDNAMTSERSSLISGSFTSTPLPPLEVGDRIVVSDTYSGISASGIVKDFKTNVDFSSGSMSQSTSFILDVGPLS